MKSELANKFSKMKAVTLSLVCTTCSNEVAIALLPHQLQDSQIHRGDVYVMRTDNNVSHHLHLVIVEGRTRDAESQTEFLSLRYYGRSLKSLANGGRIHLMGEIGSVTTSRRQLDALQLLLRNATLHSLLMHRDDKGNHQLRRALLEKNNFTSLWDPSFTWNWSSPRAERLNSGQLAAVEMAMTNRVSLIQGPPGTGKTHTTAVLLHTYINYFNDGNLKVLATAPSNHAAQLLAKKFVEILFHAENWKTMPICVLQCDASRQCEGFKSNLNCGFHAAKLLIF